MLDQTIGFLGAGQMARALAAGLVRAKLAPSSRILASDVSSAARDAFAAGVPGSRTVETNAEVTRAADVVILAVKPQQVGEVLRDIAASTGPKTLLISIAAGVRLATLASGLGEQVRLVRVMPNTPCLVGQGASGFCLGPRATDDDRRLVQSLLSAVGVAREVDEKLLDAVTGLSGSGPAFVYVVIEALADGGVRMGLPRDTALELAAQTVRGAAEMVLSTREHPAVLKDKVTSPGGTTIAGLQALEAGKLRSVLISGVEAATRRSAELGSL